MGCLEFKKRKISELLIIFSWNHFISTTEQCQSSQDTHLFQFISQYTCPYYRIWFMLLPQFMSEHTLLSFAQLIDIELIIYYFIGTCPWVEKVS